MNPWRIWRIDVVSLTCTIGVDLLRTIRVQNTNDRVIDDKIMFYDRRLILCVHTIYSTLFFKYIYFLINTCLRML